MIGILTVFHMPEKPEIEDIRRYLSLSPKDLVSLWTLQQPGAIYTLKEKGELSGNKDFAYSSKPTNRGKEGAYCWMVKQASARQGNLWTDLPIWCSFHELKDSRYKNDTLLQVSVPKYQITPSFYDPWVEILHIFSMIHNRNWPTQWCGTRPNINFFEEKQENCFIPLAPSEAVCRRSWEDIFNLELGLRQKFNCSRTLQAVLPKIITKNVVGEKIVPQSEYHAGEEYIFSTALLEKSY